MNPKKITLSFIAITLSLALIQFSFTPIAVAGPPHNKTFNTMKIIGSVIPSQSNDLNSNEPNYEGGFVITVLPTVDGEFEGKIEYIVVNPTRVVANPEFVDDLTFDLFPGQASTIFGTYKYAKQGLMLEFSGNGFSGQIKNDPRAPLETAFIGFINTPGSGYLSQVFVGGCVDGNQQCIDLLSQL